MENLYTRNITSDDVDQCARPIVKIDTLESFGSKGDRDDVLIDDEIQNEEYPNFSTN